MHKDSILFLIFSDNIREILFDISKKMRPLHRDPNINIYVR